MHKTKKTQAPDPLPATRSDPPEVRIRPRTLFEAGQLAAGLLDPSRAHQLYRDIYRELDGEFADGFRRYVHSTGEWSTGRPFRR